MSSIIFKLLKIFLDVLQKSPEAFSGFVASGDIVNDFLRDARRLNFQLAVILIREKQYGLKLTVI